MSFSIISIVKFYYFPFPTLFSDCPLTVPSLLPSKYYEIQCPVDVSLREVMVDVSIKKGGGGGVMRILTQEWGICES